MQGAVDNIDTIKSILEELAINRYYLHADAALSGMILPFVDEPQPFTFADGVHSLAVSGHKLLGAPLPCGIVLALRENVERIARSVEYVGVRDTTIMGSRSAFSPLMIWYALQTLGEEGIRTIIQRSFELADYAIEKMKAIGLEAWRHKNSITVIFQRPSDTVLANWQVAPYKRIAHIITLPHMDESTIDRLIADIQKYPVEK
jgi:histidine decarboxylase